MLQLIGCGVIQLYKCLHTLNCIEKCVFKKVSDSWTSISLSVKFFFLKTMVTKKHLAIVKPELIKFTVHCPTLISALNLGNFA